MTVRSQGAGGYPRLFDVDQADGLVPHLVRSFSDVERDRRALHAIAAKLAAHDVDLTEPLPLEIAGHPELSPQLEHLARLQVRIKASLQQLADMGIEVKGIEGLVDVRSRYQGRQVCLCWKLGEPRFTHWHELDGGFAGRQAIVDRTAFEGTLLN